MLGLNFTNNTNFQSLEVVDRDRGWQIKKMIALLLKQLHGNFRSKPQSFRK